MSRVVSMMSVVGLTMAVAIGCGETSSSDAPAQASGSPATSQSTGQPTQTTAAPAIAPEKIVTRFLEAVRSGDDATAAAMLTPLALQRTAEHDLSVAPTGSATAQFTVGEVDYVEDGGAHVASTWSDVDAAGNRRADTLVWMMRREDNGWRIAGLGTVVFPDQPPLFLNFEDPEDMLNKQQLTEQEITRRATEAAAATNASTSASAAPVARQAQVPQQLPQQVPQQSGQRQVQSPASGAAPRR